MNPYLPKVLENLGALVYEELENEGQIYFNITSVVSSHGEQLMLKQVNDVGNWFLYLLCFGWFFVSIFNLTFRLYCRIVHITYIWFIAKFVLE